MPPVLREVLREGMGWRAVLPPLAVAKAAILPLVPPCSRGKDGLTPAESARNRRRASVG